MKKNKKIKVIVIYGGPSFEHDISVKTGRMVVKNLDKELYKVEKVKVSRNGKWFFNDSKKSKSLSQAINTLIQSRYDVVFLALHGEFGEDGCIQAILDALNMPYTGSGVLASVLSMDKEKANMVFKANGFYVPKFYCFGLEDWRKDKVRINKKILKNFGYPVIVKPNTGGSSVAIFIIKTPKELEAALKNVFKKFSKVMIQEFIKGEEVTCGVIEIENNKLKSLPPIRIIPQKSNFYDYKSKYNLGGSIHELPAKLSAKIIKNIQNLSLKAHQIIGCKGMSRTDFILNNGKLFVLEINTIPGMTNTSLLPEAAQAIGISFKNLLSLIINSALIIKNKSR